MSQRVRILVHIALASTLKGAELVIFTGIPSGRWTLSGSDKNRAMSGPRHSWYQPAFEEGELPHERRTMKTI